MPLSRSDLWSLEEYAEQRPTFRARVLEHKKVRQLPLGEHARLYFEDELTIRYQIQEMLRIEKVFEADGIMEELEAYNPLIPDGHNWKATFMLEYEDPAERALRLGELIGIENKVWLQVQGCERIYPIADEDLDSLCQPWAPITDDPVRGFAACGGRAQPPFRNSTRYPLINCSISLE